LDNEYFLSELLVEERCYMVSFYYVW
jgi:hypothetical protein